MRTIEDLAKGLGDFDKAVERVNREIERISYDPSNKASVDRAIQEANKTIDTQLRRYAGNPMLAPVISEMKKQLRDIIRADAVTTPQQRTGANLLLPRSDHPTPFIRSRRG